MTSWQEHEKTRGDVEQAILSALLLDQQQIYVVEGIIGCGMFNDPRHRVLWHALLAMDDRGVPIDPLTLCAELERTGELRAAGDRDYIGYLIDIVPTSLGVVEHAETLRDWFRIGQ